MKNKKLPGVLIAATLGLVCFQMFQCANKDNGLGCQSNSCDEQSFPDKVFLRLSGVAPHAHCRHPVQEFVPAVTLPVQPFLGSVQRPATDAFIPPYVLQELKIRNPQNLSIVNTINMTEAIENGTFFLQPGKKSNTNTASSSAKIEVYDAKGGEDRPGEKARFEGDKPTGDAEVDSCYEFTTQIRKFYKDIYDRNSIDGNGMKLVSTVNFSNEFNNAFWDGHQVTYGRPGSSSPFRTFVLLDIAAHEVTHGVTQKDTNLEYYGQPGALNESLSDVYGNLVVQFSKKQTADQANWLVGDGIWKKGIKGKALRDMLNPGTAYDDPKIGKDPQPAHMKDYIKTRGDNGGVHYNSGIPNRAFALFARDVGGYAWEEPGKIWYLARKLSGKNPSFAQFAHQTLEAAKKLGYDKHLEKLTNAWEGVGVKPSASAGDKDTPKLDGELGGQIQF